MEPMNQTDVSVFLLLGLTNYAEVQPLIFSLFLSIYLITILGNLLIILAVSSHPKLQNPMYFFLSNLSFTDISIGSSTIPKVLVNTYTQDQHITYTGCLTQLSCVLSFGGLENCLLAVMAYDCYVAICHPLRYTTIMSPCLCMLLVLVSMFISTMHALLHTLMVLQLSFCADLEIPHFFCELTQIIKLACSDTLVNTLLVYSVSSLFVGLPLTGIVFSYTQIFSSIMRLSSVRGRYKAFSTCGSHLSVVSLFYGTVFVVYMSSAVSNSLVKNVLASMMYIVGPQMLNPFMYSLRNREIKGALRHVIIGTPTFVLNCCVN